MTLNVIGKFVDIFEDGETMTPDRVLEALTLAADQFTEAFRCGVTWSYNNDYFTLVLQGLNLAQEEAVAYVLGHTLFDVRVV